MNVEFNHQRIDEALQLLNYRLEWNDAPTIGLVVCGGASLIAMGLISRITSDVDIVALMDENHQLIAPAPLPDYLLKASSEVAKAMNLPMDWLNNGPSREEGGIFQMGLPAGFQERLYTKKYGDRLTVYFIDRTDQIHFKLYASVDRGGYHIADLEALHPTTEELTQAARWACTHDVSEAFRSLIKRMLEELGYGNAACDI